jgi:hypothetical protein
MSYAQDLADSISVGKELQRIEQAFRSGGKMVKTSLTTETLKGLGFVLHTYYHNGTWVSLPERNNSQYGDR